MVAHRFQDPDPPEPGPGHGRDDHEMPMPKGLLEQLHRLAHEGDNENETRTVAKATFRASPKRQQRIARRERNRRRHERKKARANESLETCQAERDKHSMHVGSRRQATIDGLFTLANGPALIGLLTSVLIFVASFGCELLSATLLMWNSGWGLTESVFVMVGIVATFVVQPFLSTKLLVKVLPLKLARGVERFLAAVGVPFGIYGFGVAAWTLGGMMSAPEFSFTAAATAVEEFEPSEQLYIFTAMVSLWLGSYSAFFFVMSAVDTLFPVVAEPHPAYSALSEKIAALDEEIALADEELADVAAQVEMEDALEQAFVCQCLGLVRSVRTELDQRRSLVTLASAAKVLN